jgi:hypothetical protein
MSKNLKTQIEKINPFVKKAFGDGFFGNYIELKIPGISYIVKAGEINTIAKKEFFYIPKLNKRYKIAGEFTSKDGSEMKVSAEYLNNAEIYAKLYEEDSGKSVSIKIR